MISAKGYGFQGQGHQALGEFQIKDFELRKRAMESIGQTYAWSEFQRDVQQLHNAEAGWQRAWWEQKLKGLNSKQVRLFQANLPSWYAVAKAAPHGSFVLGAYDPEPQKSWLCAWQSRQLQQPKNGIVQSAIGNMAAAPSQTARAGLEEIWGHGVQNLPAPSFGTDFGSGF